MTTLVLAEHDNSSLRSATRNTITAAKRYGGPVTVLVAGHDCAQVAQQAAAVEGVGKVLLADDPAYRHALAEPLAVLLDALCNEYSCLLTPATTCGKNVLPRVAALRDVAMISDVVAIEGDNTYRCPIYAGNIIATVKSIDALQVISVRATAFEAAAEEGGNAVVETIAAPADPALSKFRDAVLTKSDRPELASAARVVSGGRGLGSAEHFKLIETLADKLGAAVGASRAAVDAGFVPNDCQIGQTGKVVAPELYLAIGISGAIQHLAGMKESKVIVAINKDEEAPIFQVADYGLCADLFEALPELIERIG